MNKSFTTNAHSLNAQIMGSVDELGNVEIHVTGRGVDVVELWCKLSIQIASGLDVSTDDLFHQTKELERVDRIKSRYKNGVDRMFKAQDKWPRNRKNKIKCHY